MIYFYRKYSDLSSVAEEKPDKPDKTVRENIDTEGFNRIVLLSRSKSVGEGYDRKDLQRQSDRPITITEAVQQEIRSWHHRIFLSDEN